MSSEEGSPQSLVSWFLKRSALDFTTKMALP